MSEWLVLLCCQGKASKIKSDTREFHEISRMIGVGFKVFRGCGGKGISLKKKVKNIQRKKDFVSFFWDGCGWVLY